MMKDLKAFCQTCFFLASCTAQIVSVASEDAVYLKKSDMEGTMSSFLTNSVNAGYGWSDGSDPDKNKDYRLDGKILFTPYGTSSEQYVFPGRSLTIDKGGALANRSCDDDCASKVYVGNLIVKKGTITNKQWARKNIWDGVFTFDGDASVTNGFSINLNSCIIDATLKSAAGINVKLNGTEGNKKRQDDKYYQWSYYPLGFEYYFNGDCSNYLATNLLSWSAAAYLGTSEFGGSFNLGNIGYLSLGSTDSTIIRGSVFGRDGWLTVPAGKSMDVKGGMDFAFADRGTHVFDGTDVYIKGYIDANSIEARGSTLYVNAVQVEDGASLSTTSASLSGTLISVGQGSVFTIGDLSLDGCILDCAGEIIVTNSLSTGAPVVIVPSVDSVRRDVVLRIPLSQEESAAESNFKLKEGTDTFRFGLEWKKENDMCVLYCTDKACGIYDQTTGYVTLTNGETTGTIKTKYSFDSDGFWSDGQKPHSTTNYYAGKTLWAKGDSFQGGSLTLNSILRISTTKTITFDDLRVLAKGEFNTAGGSYVSEFSGAMYVYSTKYDPFKLYGGLTGQRYVINMSIFGSPMSAITIDGPNTRAPGEVSVGVDFTGDCNQYYGLLTVGTNETLRLGNSGLPNGTVELRTAYSVLSSVATNNAEISVGAFRTAYSSSVEVPATNVISFASMDVTGVLTKQGEGTLCVHGRANAKTGARLDVVSGGICAMSSDTFEKLPVVLKNGAKLVLNVESSGDLKDFGIKNLETTFSNDNENGLIPVSFIGTLDEDTVYVAICTVSATADPPAFSFLGKYGCHKISSAQWRTNADGTKTLVAKLVKAGMILSIR